MVDLDELKGRIKAKRQNYETCSEALGISRTAFSNKMNGNTDFTVPEANALSKFLGLTGAEAVKIFLP